MIRKEDKTVMKVQNRIPACSSNIDPRLRVPRE